MSELDRSRDREAAIRARAMHPGPVRHRLEPLLAAALCDASHAPDLIARMLREARELHSAERRFVADAAHEILRHRRRLAWFAGSDQPGALLEEWLRMDGENLERLDAIADPVERLAITHSYPSWIVERVTRTYGMAPGAELLASMNARAPLSVRANRLKCDRDQLAARLLSDEQVRSLPSPLAPDGSLLDTHRNVYAMAAFRDGWMEIQDEGSQVVAELCAPPPRGAVLDACAGAGGKTLALGARLLNRGKLVALDVNGKKLEELRRRARRAGLTNVQALLVDEAQLAPASFDRVLCDVPCSGLGVVRRHPETKWRLQPDDLDELAQKQRAILRHFAPLVRPAGRLIYATCSILAQENDAIVDEFLVENSDFQVMPTKEIFGKERALSLGDGERLRLLPHQHRTDGFFAAVLRRAG